MIHKQWIITDYCKSNIKKLGFYYDSDLDVWRYTFPLRHWNRTPVLFCLLYIGRDKDYLSINVIDSFGEIYTPYYCQEYGQYGRFLKTIDNKIMRKLNSIGIIERKKERRNSGNKN